MGRRLGGGHWRELESGGGRLGSKYGLKGRRFKEEIKIINQRDITPLRPRLRSEVSGALWLQLCYYFHPFVYPENAVLQAALGDRTNWLWMFGSGGPRRSRPRRMAHLCERAL